MKIGFDLDKIFIDTPPFIPTALLQRLYGRKINGKLQYRIPSPAEQQFRRLTHLPLFRPPLKQNFGFLKSLTQQKHTLYLISSRYNFLEDITNQLIKKHKLRNYFKDLYFNYENKQPHVFKNEVLKKLHLDIFIDDDLALLEHVAKDNPHTHFFWLNEKGENKKISKNLSSVSKIENVFQEKVK